MTKRSLLCLLALCSSGVALAGDDASGPITYSTDLSAPFTVYRMSERDRAWSRSLVEKLNYRGRVVHFVRTSLPLLADQNVIEGAIYRAVEEPGYFYVARGDAMLRIGTPWPYSPGVGGLSLHATRSRNFIVCLHFQRGGVPFRSSTPVVKGKVAWKGDDPNHERAGGVGMD